MANVLVVYYSKSGNTRKMAELVADGVRGGGSHQVRLVDVQKLDLADFLAADGFAIGSPDYFSYVAGQVKTLFDEAPASKSQLQDKPFVGFISHGGGGRATDPLMSLSKSIGLKKVAEALACKGTPEGADAQACKQLGTALAEAL